MKCIQASLFFLWVGAHVLRAEVASPEGVAFFEKEIRPILVEHCYSCHSAEEKIKGGLQLDSRMGLLHGGDSGPAILAGDPEASLLIQAVRYTNRDLQMPPKNALSGQQVAALEAWIRMGAPDPRTQEATFAGEESGMSIEEGREFWSFRPLANPTVPEVRDTDWVETPVDTFVLAKLERQGLASAPRADKRTLLRRVTFDLTGLPPTRGEMRDFLADDSSDAFAKVVERLLASPQYGVRWGRHWLDVARYADSNGLDENLGFGQAWRYRDYVVDAFNADKPYDRFLMEQIAGDLLPDANRETKTATGFLALGAKVLAEPDRQKLDMDIIDEQLDTLGKTFLGMTFGCVRCHDHKFDPVKQSDYYALAAIFKGTTTLGETKTGAIKHWFEHSFASEEERKRLEEVDAEIAARKKAASTFKSQETVRLRDLAREKAAEYLVAAAQFETSTPLTEVAKIAEPLGLHPRILHHCRMHLDFHRDDPLFAPWHAWAAAGELEAIRAHYELLFAEATEAFLAVRKKDPKAKQIGDPRLEPAREALYDLSGFLAVPTKPEHAFEEEALAEYNDLMDEARAFESEAPDETAAMGVCDGEAVAALPIHIRGSYKNLGTKVERGFPLVMRQEGEQIEFAENSSGRLELAQWMARPEHPLTARVMVNRVWGWHFGEALARTTENFGKLGDRPSHPELLDWLARHFTENGWSIKELHRVIVLSSTYQQASLHPNQMAYAAVDPENRLLWRAHLQRLEAEQVRDAVLAVSGQLELGLGGKTLPLRNHQFVFNHTSEDHTKYDSHRRALYLPVIRNNLYSFFEQFDYPDPTMPTGSRNATVIAPQALVLMNYDLVLKASEAFAARVLSSATLDHRRVESAYEMALGRLPSSEETARMLAFIEQVTANARTGAETIDPVGEQRAWAMACQSLLASNEFIYLR